jgi:hypothetical protein
MSGARHPRQELLLASMRVAVLNLRTWSSEIEMIGVALRSGALDVDGACLWLADLGLLEHLPEPQQVPAA